MQYDNSESGHGLLRKPPQAILMAAFVGTSLLERRPAHRKSKWHLGKKTNVIADFQLQQHIQDK